MITAHWQFWVDRGGTFTDIVALSPEGKLHRLKLLSDNPEHYADAAEEAMRRLTGVRHGPLPPCELRLGTTVATNALLERKGAPVLLAITKGLGDALRIGTQDRPEIFALDIVLPEPLYAAVTEIDERVGADGTVHTPLDQAQARAALQAAYDKGLRAVAVALAHGYRYPAHEQRLGEIAREVGFTQISLSHEVAPLIGLVGRGDTTVADASLTPVLRTYLDRLESGIGPNVATRYMTSNGGLVPSARFRGRDAILSGPAGGIVAMAAVAQGAGYDDVLGFDMGGTSTDVSHYAGHYERDGETRVSGVRLRTPILRIATVAAGGGSICRFDGARFVVGPESAGAVPGPACYRRGGPLTLTDCNVILGKIQPDHFPPVFGPNADQPLDRAAAEAAMDAVLADLARAGRAMSRAEAAEGFIAIGVAAMANAIKSVSLRRGHDPARAAMVCFGGAGGQHAARVADALGIGTVIVHPLASVLSAYGMGLARVSAVREATLALPLDDGGIAARVSELEAEARAALGEPGEVIAQVHIRPPASSNAIEVPFADGAAMRASFAEQWQRRFGFAAEGDPVAEFVRVEAISAPSRHDSPIIGLTSTGVTEEPGQVAVRADGIDQSAPLYQREALAPSFTAPGPALIVDDVSSVMVEPGWTVTVDPVGNLILKRTSARAHQQGDSALDPVRLEIMGALYMAVAEEMGAALQASARSVNIRERLDFSCAVFDRHGNLIANAPHMPVHLGSMGESVRAVMARAGTMRPGDAFALNAPWGGGTHLPDITVVMPVFAQGDAVTPAWFVAARGHHADVGGISPGSMPPDSRTLAEEGVVLDCLPVLRDGHLLEDDLRAALASSPFPARNPDQNVADLKAQIAACARGASELTRLAAEQGRVVVDAYMGHVQDYAEAAVRALIGGLDDGTFALDMDNGARICVAVRLDRKAQSATIDFTGTSPELPSNFNAPLPVVRAAVLYVVRCMVGGAMPMNEGCMRPLKLIVPEGSMLSPGPEAAVVAGNVETSQAITDALFAAFGVLAASQGTMNNFTFGDAAQQYYETIAGGAGASARGGGASAVQTHMTNSRLTDVEVMEANFPVLVERFAVRRGSGGAGEHRGGDGVERRIRFLAPMRAGILANRRATAPFGLGGGAPGRSGVNRIERADGTREELPATAGVEMAAGDVFVIETPGGGGFGGG